MAMFLAGGGNPEQEAQVWRAAFAGVSEVVYWPFALPEERLANAESWLRRAVASLGISARVTTWTSLVGRSGSELAGVDLVFVGGGTTSKLAAHVHRHGFEQILRDYLTSGGRYYGGSAGAILACASISLASLVEDDPRARDAQGLGIFTSGSVLPHADTFPRGTAESLAAKLGHDVFALPEASGLYVHQDEVIPIGPGTVHVAHTDGSSAEL